MDSTIIGTFALFNLLEDELVSIAYNVNYKQEYLEYLVRIRDYNLILAIDYMATHKRDIYNDEFQSQSEAYMDKAMDELHNKFTSSGHKT